MKTEGSIALVSGGASGLGFAAAQRLSLSGARVVIVDLPTSAGAAAAEKLSAGSIFVPADVRDAGQVESAVRTATGCGALRIAVNAAGTAAVGPTLGEQGPLDLDSFSGIVISNLIGTFNVIRLTAAAMAATTEIEGEKGVIVNTASIAAFDGLSGQAAYAASKAGIAGMTLPIARDLAKAHIRVMTIAPGMFNTPFLKGLSDQAVQALVAQIPHPNRLGSPEEYAMLVEHIVANPMLNGEVIRLDGAIRMAPM